VVFLFDLDGTILDTTDLILQSFIHAFSAGIGEEVTRADVISHFGRPLWDQFRTMRPDLDDEAIDRLVAIYREHNESRHDGWVTVVPGADRSLYSLKEAGHRLGIVTSKGMDLTRRGLQLFNLDGLFEVIVHRDSTTLHKPHPEPVAHALTLMGAQPEMSCFMGDSPYDMRSGRAAGVMTLGLVHNTFSEEDLRRAGADSVVFHWEDALQVLTAMSAAIEPIQER
jgi:pyrophosphatase PpaX